MFAEWIWGLWDWFLVWSLSRLGETEQGLVNAFVNWLVRGVSRLLTLSSRMFANSYEWASECAVRSVFMRGQ